MIFSLKPWPSRSDFSTHIMDLALDLCDEIVLLNHGMLERIDKSNLDSHEFKDKIIAALRVEEHA